MSTVRIAISRCAALYIQLVINVAINMRVLIEQHVERACCLYHHLGGITVHVYACTGKVGRYDSCVRLYVRGLFRNLSG
jgi:hypothetical protein